MNTTTVDFFGISVMLDLVLADGTSMSRGFSASRQAVFAALETLPDTGIALPDDSIAYGLIGWRAFNK